MSRSDVSHTVVDVDAHFLDTSKDLAAYMSDEEPWTERFEEARMDMLPNPTPDLYRGGRITRDDVGYPVDHDDVVAIQQEVGFDKIVMIPMAALLIASIQADDRRPELLARGFVDLMLDRIVDPDEGIYSVIPAPTTDPAAAAELIDEYGATMAESTQTYETRTAAREAMNDVKAQAPDGWITFTE